MKENFLTALGLSAVLAVSILLLRRGRADDVVEESPSNDATAAPKFPADGSGSGEERPGDAAANNAGAVADQHG